MGKQWKQWETSFLGSKITADDNCSHEIKRCFLLWRKAVSNLYSMLKSRDITLPTKVRVGKIPWRRKWQPIPVLLAGKFHERRNLVHDSPWDHKEFDVIEQLHLLSQSYGFSSGQVWIWELDYKESWEPKNWCFWTVVLEKTLENPLDCKEIQPVHPKRNQSWILFEGLRLKLKLPTLVIWCKELTHWKRPWCWERLKAGGEGDNRG